ncbi:MAG: DUF2997 domain-containing protein [Planctomycetes bacterium]|nr:DUF2997 domain-containing protein [Planctomycetota bacterium]
MKKPTIDISIGKDGKVKIKVHGVSGKECLALTEAVAKIIGKEESRQLTSEYFGDGGQVRTHGQTESHVRGG